VGEAGLHGVVRVNGFILGLGALHVLFLLLFYVHVAGLEFD
jgi:hypothetical protein